MKRTLLLLALFTAINSTAQQASIEYKNDTLNIIDFDITNNPFDFGLNPYSKLISEHEVKIGYNPFVNHLTDKTDTIFCLNIKQDKFYVYKKDNNNSFIILVELLEKRFKTRLGFHVGMNKSDFKKLFPKYNISRLPDHVFLENIETSESFYIRFIDDKIYSIKFDGYFD